MRRIITAALLFEALLLTALSAFDGAYAQQGKDYARQGERPEGYGPYRGGPMNLELEPKQAAKMQTMRNAFFMEGGFGQW